MKKLAVVSICVLCFSCNQILTTMPVSQYPMTLDEAYIAMEPFVYIWDTKPEDEWKTPDEFERDGGGDCEDFAVYALWLLGEEAQIVIVNLTKTNHAIIVYRGTFYDPQCFRLQYTFPEEARITCVLSYHIIFPRRN